MVKKQTWGDLFEYVSKKVNFHEKIKGDVNSTTWTCKGGKDKTFVKEFCEAHNISFNLVEGFLELCGGYCDCEVLFNATNQLKDDDPIGKINIDCSKGIQNLYDDTVVPNMPKVDTK
jgi:hypothetical protein